MNKLILIIFFVLPFSLKAQSYSNTLLQNELKTEWQNQLGNIIKSANDSNCEFYLHVLNDNTKNGESVLDSLICTYYHLKLKNEVNLMSVSFTYSQCDDVQLTFNATYYLKDKTVSVSYDAMIMKWEIFHYEQKYANINKEKMLKWIEAKNCLECWCYSEPTILSLIKDDKIIKTKISQDTW